MAEGVSKKPIMEIIDPYDDPVFTKQRMTRHERGLDNEKEELNEIKGEYNRSRKRNFCSFRAIDSINVTPLVERWGKEYDAKEIPCIVMAKLILEQKLVAWAKKYNKNPDNIDYLLHTIINDKEECNVETNK